MRKDDYMSKAKANNYRTGRFRGRGGRMVEEHERSYIIKTVKAHLKNKLHSSHLDYAGGTGRITKYIVELLNFKKSTLADSSQYMIEQAKKFVDSTNVKYLLVGQDKEPKPLKGSYDLITTFHFIKHIPNPEAFFKRFAEVQKKDSLLVFDFLNSMSIVALRKETCYLYSKQRIVQLLKDANYEIVDSKHTEMLGETIYIGQWLPGPLLNLYNLVDNFISSYVLRPFCSKIIITARKIR